MATKRNYFGTYWLNQLEVTMLFSLLKRTAGDFLEIGTFHGIIATMIARKFPQKQINCVDLFKKAYGTEAGDEKIWYKNVKKYKLKNIRLYKGDSRKIVPKLRNKYGFIFVDGNHSYPAVKEDLKNCWRKLNEDGVLAFHDYKLTDQATKAIEEFRKEKKLKIFGPIGSFGFIYKKEGSSPPFSYYVLFLCMNIIKKLLCRIVSKTAVLKL